MHRCSSSPILTRTPHRIRIQSAPFYLNDRTAQYVMTEKVDGSSGTFALVRHKRFLLPDKFEYYVCSRNRRLPVPDASIYWAVSDKYKLEATLRNMIGKKDWIAIQGECVGPKVQGNKYKLTEPRLFAFNLIDSASGRHGSTFAAGLLETRGIDFVPILGTNRQLPETVDEMVAMADGKSVINRDVIREGLVVRSADGSISFKAVSNAYLLKYKE